MSVQLVILGLLSERPGHGYELRQAVERRAYATYINLSGGSLYYNLSQLEQSGYIEKAWTEQKGKYPARQVFQITPAGKEFLQAEVRRLFFDIDGRMKYFDPLHAALAFGHHVNPSEVREALTAQLRYIRQRLQEVEEQRAYWLQKGIPFLLLKIIEHAHVLLKAEVAWLEDFLRQLSEASQRGTARSVRRSGSTDGNEPSERSPQSTQPDNHPKEKNNRPKEKTEAQTSPSIVPK
jgi:DNA-binding PadR family transcriptional regulator